MRKTNYMLQFLAIFSFLLWGNGFTLFASHSLNPLQPSPSVEYMMDNGYRAVYVTVADGTTTNSFLPVYGLYLDKVQQSQIIYEANLLTALVGENIGGLKFYTSNTPSSQWTGTITVSLGITALTDLSAGFITTTFTDVYQGRLVVSNQEMEIEFTTPFPYNGGNLVVKFDQPVGGNYASAYFYGITATATGRMGYEYNYATGTSYDFLPKTTFSTPITCPKPTSFVCSQLTHSNATFTWVPGFQETAWELEYGARGFTLGTGTTIQTNVDSAMISSLTPETHYDIYVRGVCGVGDSSFWVGPLSFTTPQILGIVPYLSDFEDADENANWGFARNAIAGYPNNWYIDTAAKFTGLKGLYISNNLGINNAYTTASAACAVWAYRDVYFTPAGEYEFSFDWKAIGQTTVDYMRVYIGTPTAVNPSTSTSFTAPAGATAITNPLKNNVYFNAFDGTDNTFINWNHFSTTLPGSFAGSTYRIYFLWVNNDIAGAQPPAAIDNLSIIGRNCTSVSNIGASNITIQSALLNWTIGFQEDVFEIVYTTHPNFDPDTLVPIVVNDTNTYQLTGLTAVTTYYVKIRAVCGVEHSSWSETYSFTTDQIPATLPYSCDFEDPIESVNWQFANSTADTKWVLGTAMNNTPSGNYSVYISSNNGVAATYSAAATVWAYRDVNFDVLGDYHFTFDWQSEGESSYDFMRVFIGDQVTPVGNTSNTPSIPAPAGSNATMLTPTPITNTSYPTYFNKGGAVWQQYAGTLPANYYGTTKRLYFAWTNDGSVHNPPSAVIDNIVIDVNTCISVSNVVVPDSSITINSATVHWTSIDSNWIVEYKLSADSIWTTLSVSTNPYTLTNLIGASDYMVRIKTDCGNGSESFYSSIVYFATQCDVIRSFPWNYNFEETWISTGTNTAPRCWNNIDLFNATYEWDYSSSQGVNSSGCAYFYGSFSTANNDFLITPYMDLTGNEQLRFQVKNYGSSYSPKLTIMGLASQTSTVGSIIRTITVNHNTYQEYTVDISAFQGEYCIAFARRDTGQYHVYIDNLYIEPIPACVKPSSIVISNITADSATISWTAAPGTTDFEIALSTNPSFNPDSVALIPVVGATQYSAHSLSSVTTYYFYIRTDCGGLHSDWTDLYSFTTNQLPATLPYFCDFEDVAENSNWQFANQTNLWMIGTSTYNSPSRSLYVSDDGVNYGYGNNNSDIWAYRDITFPAGNLFSISFDWKGVGEIYYGSNYDYMKVYIGNIAPISSSTTVASGPTGATNLGGEMNQQATWTTFSATLGANYAGQTKRLYFGWTEDGLGSDGPPAAVDNLSIQVVSCFDISGLTVPVASITENSAVVTWTAGGTETDWIVEYKKVSDGSWTLLTVTTNPVCTLTNLTPAENYQVRVQADCGNGDLSNVSAPVNFTTSCPSSPLTIPWSYNFESTWESVGNRTAPRCWNNIDNGSGSYYWRYNSSLGIGSSGCAYFYGTSNISTQNNAWLITPTINFTGNDYLVFYARNFSSTYSPILSVYLLSDPNDTTSSTLIGRFNANSSTYKEFNADLSAYSGTYSLAFARVDKGNEGLYLDNISLIPLPSCIKPSGLTVSNIGGTNATLSWTAGDANPSGYEIAYSTVAGFDPDTTANRIIIGDTTSYTFPLGTLTPITTYYVYVRTLCGANDSSVWNNDVLIFSTVQIPATLPYYCDFEDPAINSQWQFANSTADTRWVLGTAMNNTPLGSYSAYISSNNGVAATYSAAATVWFYRDISFDVAGEYTLSFDWRAIGESSWDFMSVFVGSPVAVTGTTTNLRPIPAPVGANAVTLSPTPVTNSSYPSYFNLGGSGWQRYENTLPANYYGTTKRIYFAWTNDGSGHYPPGAVIDNIVIDVNPCVRVTNLIVPDSSITDNSAMVYWVGNGTDTVWSLEYKTATAQTWTVVSVSGISSYQLTGLAAGVAYQVRVRTDCGGGDYSYYTPIVNFNARQIPATVPYICGFEDAAENQHWQFANNLNPNNNWYIGPAIKHGGDSSLYVSQDYGTTNTYNVSATCVVWAYRDIYFTPAGEYILSFDWRCYGELTYDYMLVYIGDPTSVASTTTSTVVPPVNATALINDLRTSNQTYFNGHDGSGYNNITWNTYSSYLDGNYSGKTKRLYFAWRNDLSGGYQGPAAVDNISITPVTCARPMNLSIAVADTTSVTIAWESASGEENFEIAFSTQPGFIVDTCTNRIFVTDTNAIKNYTFTGLTPNSPYYIYIRSLCGESTLSNWTSIFPFMTMQVPLVVPFVCDFEDDSENANWGIMNNNTATHPNAWYIDSAANHGGLKSLYISNNSGITNAYTATSCIVWAYRDIYFGTIGDYELIFDWKCWGESSYDYMSVYIGDPQPVSPLTTNTLVAPQGADTIKNSLTGLDRFNAHDGSAYVYTSWNTETLVLKDYYGQTKRIYFAWKNDALVTNQPPAAVDNMEVKIYSCLSIANMIIPDSSITTNSATIHWTNRGDESSWIIEYRLTSDNTWMTVTANTNPYTLDSLNSSSMYAVRIKADCGDGAYSLYSPVQYFTTLCGTIVNLPWNYTFDDPWINVGNRTAPYCWNNIDNGSTYYYWRLNETQGVGSSRCAYFYGTSSTATQNDATLITPEITFTGNEQIVFYAKNYSSSYSPILSIYALTDQNDANSGTLISTFTVSNNAHVEFETSLASLTGNYYIAFKREDNGNEGLYLDNIIIEPIPTCIKPSLVTVTNAGGTYATINWTTRETAPLGYEIAIGTTPDFNPDTATLTFITGDTTSYTLPTGTLEPSSTYYVYVRTICTASDTSVWNNFLATLQTSQIPLQVPFMVDFEDANENANWQFYNQTNKWTIGEAVYNSPTHALYVSPDGTSYGTYTNSSQSIWAFRDVIFPQGDEFTLTFDWKCVGELIYSAYDYMKVYIGDIRDVSTVLVESGPQGTVALGGTYVDQASWRTFTTTLQGTQYSGTTKRIYFGWRDDFSGTDGPPAAVDNFSITLNCSKPTTIYVLSVSDTSADISWVGSEMNYNIEYGPQGFSQGSGTTIAVQGTTYTITGLAANTAYDMYIQADCGENNTSDWLPYSFTTAPVGINDLNYNQEVTIYPNPVSDLLFVESNGIIKQIEIVNSVGQVLHKMTINDRNFEIDVKNYSAGIYFIKIIGEKGFMMKKVIKE